MPIQECKHNGLSGFKWGITGTCYVYTNPTEQKAAHRQAAKQGRAIQARQRKVDARKKKAIKTLEYPAHVEARYAVYMRRQAKMFRDILMSKLAPVLSKQAPDINERAQAAKNPIKTDSKASTLKALLKAIREAKKVIAEMPLASTVEEVATFGQGMDRLAWRRTSATVIKVPFSASTKDINSWTKTNVDLIKTIKTRYFRDIESVVKESVLGGRNTREITKILQQRFNVSKSRATLIGRDQIGKLNSQLAKKRQTDLGVETYIWQTSEDNRVRDEHIDLNETVQRWDKPPNAGTNGEPAHPGEAIQCRCIAIPILPV